MTMTMRQLSRYSLFEILRAINEASSHFDRGYYSRARTQTCRCTSSGCTTCAVRRRRYARSGRNATEATRPINLGPIGRTSLIQRLGPCSAATGSIGARASSLSGLLCNPATRSTKSPSRYRGKLCVPQHFLLETFVPRVPFRSKRPSRASAARNLREEFTSRIFTVSRHVLVKFKH